MRYFSAFFFIGISILVLKHSGWRRGSESIKFPRVTGPVYRGLRHFGQILLYAISRAYMRSLAILLAAEELKSTYHSAGH